ncbi:MAG TPA: sugar-binding protein [Saprospiraceae bacterium]|nr:sugar-binding protein [Saprospiraceae bacterium]
MKNTLILLIAVIAALVLTACSGPQKDAATETTKEEVPELYAGYAAVPPIIDGMPGDSCWRNLPWYPIDQIWIGDSIDHQDFSGKYKVAWSEDYLYILAEIRDDTLIDIHPDGLAFYWDDDCLEIFVDEDASGGNHQYSHNAFAYHIALDGKVADIGPDSLPHYYDHHIQQRRSTIGNRSRWEVAIALYPDTYRDGASDNHPVKLHKGKTIGFALAYCDNDRSPERENFFGSVFVPGEDKNRGWIDAGIFAKLPLR